MPVNSIRPTPVPARSSRMQFGGMPVIPLPVMSSLAWAILGVSGHISYVTRDAVRVNTAPHTRKADFMQRNYIMSLVTPCVIESAFRIVDTYYTMPLMAKALGLTHIPEVLRRRCIGSFVKPDSVYTIPRVLREVDLPKAKTPQERRQLQALIEQLEKKLTYWEYLNRLAEEGKLPHKEAAFIADESRRLTEEMGSRRKEIEKTAEKLFDNKSWRKVSIRPSLKKFLFKSGKAQTWSQELMPSIRKRFMGNPQEMTVQQYREKVQADFLKNLPDDGSAIWEELEKIAARKGRARLHALADYLHRMDQAFMKKHLARLADEVWHSHPLKDEMLMHMRNTFASKFARQAIKNLQRTGTWPKLLLNIALNFISYGLISSNIDVKLVQPWQDRLVEKRGTASEVVTPVYLATIPAALTMTAGMTNRFAPQFVRRMSYLGRFMFMAGVSAAAFLGSAGVMISKKLSSPPPPEFEDKRREMQAKKGGAQPKVAPPPKSSRPSEEPSTPEPPVAPTFAQAPQQPRLSPLQPPSMPASPQAFTPVYQSPFSVRTPTPGSHAAPAFQGFQQSGF